MLYHDDDDYNPDYCNDLLDDINSFWCISNFKNTKLITQTLSKISDKIKVGYNDK